MFGDLFDILIDIFYFRRVTGNDFHVNLHTEKKIYYLMYSFIIIGILKYFLVIYLVAKNVMEYKSDAEDEHYDDILQTFNDKLLLHKLSQLILTFLFEGKGR